MGVLQIVDGGQQKVIPLRASDLQHGYIVYKAQTDFVDCQLSLDSGTNESVLAVGFGSGPGEGVADRTGAAPSQPHE